MYNDAHSGLGRKIFLYVLGLFILAIGANFFVNSGLGVAPFAAPAYLAVLLIPISYGSATMLTNTCYILLQASLMKGFRVRHLVQFTMLFIYSVFIQLTSGVCSLLMPQNLPEKILLSVAACVIMAVGMTFTVESKLIVLPSEGLVTAFADKTGVVFGSMKVYCDVAITIVSVLCSLFFLHRIEGIGIGTVLTAILTGNINKVFLFFFQDQIQMFLKHERKAAVHKPA